MRKVCFAMPGVYPMLQGVGAYGGSELRAWRLARDLASRSTCNVSMLAFDYGQPRIVVAEGVAFLRDSCNVYAQGFLAKLRWRAYKQTHRKTLAGRPLLHEQEYAAWDAANADIYITFGTTNYSARLARWCQIRQRRFILMHGSDMDLDPLEADAGITYDYPGLSVSQTDYQSLELKGRFNRKSVVLCNPVAIPEGAPFLEPRDFALWVGKSDRIKRPDRMIALARRCPHISVLMIMNRADACIFDDIKASAPENVSFVDSVQPEDMQSYYRRAFALVSTSGIEGFANSFLEAGACGTPILSLNVDPEYMLSKHKAGMMTGDAPDAAATALDELYATRHWRPGTLGCVLGENAYRYVAARHAQGHIFDCFATIVAAELERKF